MRKELAVAKTELAASETFAESVSTHEFKFADYLDDAIEEQRHFDAAMFLAEMAFRLTTKNGDTSALAAIYKEAFDNAVETHKRGELDAHRGRTNPRNPTHGQGSRQASKERSAFRRR